MNIDIGLKLKLISFILNYSLFLKTERFKKPLCAIILYSSDANCYPGRVVSNNKMDRIKNEYRVLTNRDPGRIFFVGDETAKALVGSLDDVAAQNEFEFVDVVKTRVGLKVIKVTDVHRKSKGHYCGSSILLGSSCPVEIETALSTLGEGDYVTLVTYGKDLAELARKRKKLFHVEKDPRLEQNRDNFFGILDELAVTDGFLAKKPGILHYSEDRSCAAIGLELKAEAGLHMRPAALLAKLASKYDCEAYLRNVKKGDSGLRLGSIRSVMDSMILDANKGSRLVCATRGFDAYDCITDITKLMNGPNFY